MNGESHRYWQINGIPLSATITAANRHDVTQFLPLVDAIPPVKGKPGRPRRRPDLVRGNRAYDSQPHRREQVKRWSPFICDGRKTAGSVIKVQKASNRRLE